MLTTARVRARLATRRRGLEQCGAPLLVLGLTIEGRHPVLSTANGMTHGDPLHACVREALRGLTFPPPRSPQNYTVTLNLGPGAE